MKPSILLCSNKNQLLHAIINMSSMNPSLVPLVNQAQAILNAENAAGLTQKGNSLKNGANSLKSASNKLKNGAKQLVAKDGEKIIASVNISVKTDYFEIDNLYVSKEYRRRGIAMQLLSYAIKNENKSNIVLVADANDTPKYMYEKVGFKKISEQDFYLKSKL